MFMRCLAFLIAVAALAGDNLVVNSSLDKASKGQPDDWSKLDNLTTKWQSSGGNPGGCLVFNTAVTQAAKRANDKGEPADGKVEAEQGKPGQYATVGAHEGVWAFPRPITIKPDDQYFLLAADVKGPRSSTLFYPQIFIRGFQIVKESAAGKNESYFYTPHEGGPAYSEMFGSKESMRKTIAGDRLMSYRHTLVCRVTGEDKWQHFTLGVKVPKTPRYRPDEILLKVYAMWPLGKYYFDNISFRACTKAEYDEAKKKGHSAEGF